MVCTRLVETCGNSAGVEMVPVRRVVSRGGYFTICGVVWVVARTVCFVSSWRPKSLGKGSRTITIPRKACRMCTDEWERHVGKAICVELARSR